MKKICYHGTNEENAQSILKTGFRYGTWFAANLQDALAFGGPHVFEVVFDRIPQYWQFHVDEEIPVERIVQYSVYEQRVAMNNDSLRREIMDYNLKELDTLSDADRDRALAGL